MTICCIHIKFFVLTFVLMQLVQGNTRIENKEKPRISMIYLNPNKLRDYDERFMISPDQYTAKRTTSKFMAFPRIGRSGATTWSRNEDSSTFSKRTRPDDSNTWFGPRLGRSQIPKRSLSEILIPRTDGMIPVGTISIRKPVDNINYINNSGESEVILEEIDCDPPSEI